MWALNGKDREAKGHTLGAPPENIEMHEADLYLERKMHLIKNANFNKEVQAKHYNNRTSLR